MKKLGQALSDGELDAMMDEVDTDGNGEISFEEFKAMMVRSSRGFAIFILGMCLTLNVSFLSSPRKLKMSVVLDCSLFGAQVLCVFTAVVLVATFWFQYLV
jgi:hypothetical protein